MSVLHPTNSYLECPPKEDGKWEGRALQKKQIASPKIRSLMASGARAIKTPGRTFKETASALLSTASPSQQVPQKPRLRRVSITAVLPEHQKSVNKNKEKG